MLSRGAFLSVCDISYCPPIVFKKLPTIKYKEFLVIHPHYQMIALHLSMCFPFINAPREVILDRKNKDFDRYDILFESYPITVKPLREHKLKKLRVEFSINNKDQCVHSGLLAYAILYELLKEKKVNFAIDVHPAAALRFSGDQFTLDLDWPEDTEKDLNLSLVRYGDIDQIKTDQTKYNSYMNILPKSTIEILKDDEKLQEFYYFERRFHVTRIGEYLISSTQYSMMLMLYYYFQTDNPFYLSYYLAFKHMNEEVYKHFPIEQIKDMSPFLIPMQFWPSLETPSISDALRINLDNTLNYINKTPGAKTLKPRSYYPATSEISKFDYNDSPFFHLEGAAAPLQPPAPVERG